MALIELNVDPSRRDLRIFGGILFPGFFALLGAILWKVTGSLPVAAAVWGTAFCVTMIMLIYFPATRIVYLGWMYAAYPIGWTVSHAMMAIAYYLMLTPLGIVMRTVRKDPLGQKIDKADKSYWTPRKPAESIDQYFRQF